MKLKHGFEPSLCNRVFHVATLLCLLANVAAAEDYGSIPVPTKLEALIAAEAVTIEGMSPLAIVSSESATLELSRVELNQHGQSMTGLQITFTSSDSLDRVLLSESSASQLKRDLKGLPSEGFACSSPECIRGIARCWQGYSSYVPQRICPGYRVKEGSVSGVMFSVSSNHYFLPGVEPDSVVSAMEF